MTVETFANNAQTTLNGGISAGQTTIVVASNAGFPAAAQFRILIDSEIMLVTAGQAGLTWTVTRGNSVPAPDTTTSATHLTAATVTHVLTAGAVTGFVANPVAGAVWAASALLTLTTVANSYGLTMVGPAGAGTSFGIISKAGTNSSDYSARFQTAALVDVLAARGDGATVLGGNAIFSNATARIIPGATTLTFRNNANSADNIAIADAGGLTLRSSISAPPSAAGTVAPTSYGSLPVKIDEQLLGGTAASITFPNPLPTGFRHLLVEWYARGDTAANATAILLRFNNDSAANYDWQRLNASAATTTSSESLGATSLQLGFIAAGSGTANYFSEGRAEIKQYNGTTGNKVVISHGFQGFSNASAAQAIDIQSGHWRTTATAVTRIDLLPTAGNFIAGSLFTLYGIP